MRTHFWKTFALGLVLSVAGHVTGQTRGWTGPADSVELDEDLNVRSLGEESWEPSVYTRRFKGFRMSSDSLPLLRYTKDTSAVSEETVMGYRVQIFHTDHYNLAITIRNDAMAKFQEEVYVDYESPNYKIRLGDFRRSEQAEELKEYAKTLGYPDAWVIRTKVIIRKE